MSNINTETNSLDFRSEAEKLLTKLPLLREWKELRQLHDDSQPRAFIVEFAGMPKAGKSSAIENIRHFFSHGYKVKIADETSNFNHPANRYQVYTPAEGVSLRTPSVLKGDGIDYNTWAGAYGVHELIQASHDTHNDLVILDRGPWDAGCWLEYWKYRNSTENMNSEYVDEIANFFQLKFWVSRSDFHVVLTVDPSEAANREQESRLIRHSGFASDVNGMTKMREIYQSRYNELHDTKMDECPHVGPDSSLLLETTDKKPTSVALEIIQAIFRVLEIKVAHQVDALQNDTDEFQLSTEWLNDELEPSVKKMRGTKKELLSFVPEYVTKVNQNLKPLQIWRLKRQIREAASHPPNLLFSRADITNNPLSASLENLLSRV